MLKEAVIITGVNGGIGTALCSKFSDEGFAVIGLDKTPNLGDCEVFLNVDSCLLTSDPDYQGRIEATMIDTLRPFRLKGLINNAATQILGSIDNLTTTEMLTSLQVNTIAPFFLSKVCMKKLEQDGGSILNIGSVHSKLTKPNFIAYATSKGALESLTRAMAIELGGKVPVNLISPAAVMTPMLNAGFQNDAKLVDSLKLLHPAQTLGEPADIAELAYWLIQNKMTFLTGSIIDYSGGISGRLMDLN